MIKWFCFVLLIFSVAVLPAESAGLIQDDSFLPRGYVDQHINHTYFHLGYSNEYQQALWVAYQLSTDDVHNAVVKRTNNFREDQAVQGERAELSDYYKSGFDRGHLAPAADMAFNQLAMEKSFLLSNISPQRHSFNRGIWKKLEALTRNWAVEYGGVYVVTGGIIDSDEAEIGDGIEIPSSYYKIAYSDAKEEMIGFIIPHVGGRGAEEGAKSLDRYAVSVDIIEKRTGLDFFVELEDELENELENKVDVNIWSWKLVNYGCGEE